MDTNLKNMVFLKEDGSLDVERIDKLPIEEHMRMIAKLTDKQYHEYLSKLSINEGNNYPRNIIVNYTMEDEIRRGTAVDAVEYMKKLRKEIEDLS